MSQSSVNPLNSAASRPTWQECYWAALLELDSVKLRQRISDARHAILNRAEEILTASASEERGALNDALRALRVLEEATWRDKPAA